MIKSIKVRLTLIFTSIFALFLMALSLYFLSSENHRDWNRFDQDLRRLARTIGDLYFEEMVELEKGTTPDLHWVDDIRDTASMLQVSGAAYDGQGRLLFSTADLERLPPRSTLPPISSPPKVMDRRWGRPDAPEDYRVIYLTCSRPGRPPILVECGRSRRHVDEHLRHQVFGLAVVVPILVGLGALAGYLFVQRWLRPVDLMATQAREISAGDLSKRIPLPGSEGELKSLAETLNGMLSRLQDSFDRMRSFTSDAAHEFQTPVTTIRAALESSLNRSPEELREAVGDALEELEHLSEIVKQLLLLARADSGRLLMATRPVEMDKLAQQVHEANALRAEGRSMTMTIETQPVVVPGDPALLLGAIHNLVDNAVKYGRKGGRIGIRVAPGTVEVEDDGPGISPEHLPRLFNRFYRIDASHSDRIPGTGLGLALVKSIVEAHGGAVEVESSPGRTLFRMRLPRLHASPLPVA